MKKVLIDEKMELEVLIRDESGIGLGSTTVSQNDGYNHYTDMYQNRINLEAKDDEAIISELGEGKNYSGDYQTILEAVNGILDFWFIDPIEKITEAQEFNSIVEALEFFKGSNDNFIVFHVLR